MSSYIKSLDPHHLVTTGSEGGFNVESDDWAYNGADGSDFDAELKLTTKLLDKAGSAGLVKKTNASRRVSRLAAAAHAAKSGAGEKATS